MLALSVSLTLQVRLQDQGGLKRAPFAARLHRKKDKKLGAPFAARPKRVSARCRAPFAARLPLLVHLCRVPYAARLLRRKAHGRGHEGTPKVTSPAESSLPAGRP